MSETPECYVRTSVFDGHTSQTTVLPLPMPPCAHQWRVYASLGTYEPYMQCAHCETQWSAAKLVAILQHVQDHAPELIIEALGKITDAPDRP